jgi:hypothetical protein
LKKKRIILLVNVQGADLTLHTIKQLTPSLLGGKHWKLEPRKVVGFSA